MFVFFYIFLVLKFLFCLMCYLLSHRHYMQDNSTSREGSLVQLSGSSIQLKCNSGFVFNPSPPGSPGLLQYPSYQCQGNKWVSQNDQVSVLTKPLDCMGKNKITIGCSFYSQKEDACFLLRNHAYKLISPRLIQLPKKLWVGRSEQG